MPRRSTPLVNGEIYHVFNRGIDGRITFEGKREYRRAQELIRFYQWKNLPIRYSIYHMWDDLRQQNFWKDMITNHHKHVTLFTYTLMPNHLHFMLRQEQDHGISRFLGNIENGYTKFFNTKRKRLGQLFMNQFKAVRIEDEQQFLHVNRYIHLNPYTSHIVKTLNDLEEYPWSSLPEYFGKVSDTLCDRQLLLGLYKNATDFRTFLYDQADYQRHLAGIRHLTFEDHQFP